MNVPIYFAEIAAPFQNMNPKQSSTALFEILFMLGVAFVLGYLLHWLIGKARHNTDAYGDTDTSARHYNSVSARTSDDDTTTYTSRRRGSSRDDLTIIEGIGPRADELLRDNGIASFRELADTPVRKLQKILDEGGRIFNGLDPKTWPRQAAIARDSKMDELESYKDKLMNGR